MVIVGGGCGREGGSRGILSQGAVTVEFLPMVVSVTLPLVVIGHWVLRHVSTQGRWLGYEKEKTFGGRFFAGRISASRAHRTVWAEQRAQCSRTHGMLTRYGQIWKVLR